MRIHSKTNKLALRAMLGALVCSLAVTAGVEASAQPMRQGLKSADGLSSTVVATDGITAAGGPGIAVQRSVTPSPGEYAAVVTPSESADVAAMASAYEANGRSPVDDAIAAGVSSKLQAKVQATVDAMAAPSATDPGKIYDSFCVVDNKVYMDGEACVIRSYDTTDGISGWGIYMDQTQSLGNEASPYFWDELHLVGAKNEYARKRDTELTMVMKSPASDVTDVSNCRSIDVGGSYAGFGATIGGQICPDWWDANVSSSTTFPQFHSNDWRGEIKTADREANLVTIFKKKDGIISSYKLYLRWTVN